MLCKIRRLADLALIDGGAADLLFRRYLERAIENLQGRPTVSKTRVIHIKLLMTPVAADSGELQETLTEVEVNGNLPAARTRTISMGCAGVNGLLFNDLSPDDHKQRTLDQAPPQEGAKTGGAE